MADPGFDARLNVVGTVNAARGRQRARARRVRLHLHRRCHIWRGGGASDELPFAESAPLRARLALRPEQARGRGLCRPLPPRSAGSHGDRLRLGNVYGPRQDPRARQAWSRSSAGWPATAAADRLRRRRADPRLHTRRGRGRGAARGAARVGRRRGRSTWAREWKRACSAGRADRRRSPVATTSSRSSAGAREGEVERTVLDTSLAAKELGFEAGATLLAAAGLEQTSPTGMDRARGPAAAGGQRPRGLLPGSPGRRADAVVGRREIGEPRRRRNARGSEDRGGGEATAKKLDPGAPVAAAFSAQALPAPLLRAGGGRDPARST